MVGRSSRGGGGGGRTQLLQLDAHGADQFPAPTMRQAQPEQPSDRVRLRIMVLCYVLA